MLAELRTLSRNFRLNFTTYTGYMYIYIQHAFKCAIFYHKHSPACKAKAKDRNIGCKWTFIFSVFLGQVFASYSRHRILCLFSLICRDYITTFIFGYKNSIFFYRRRSYEVKKIRFRKSRCIGKNPVFPEVIYRYLISFP